MKIMLIEPASSNSVVGDMDINNYEFVEPLGLCYIGAVLKESGHEVSIVQQAGKGNEAIIDAARKFRQDIAGLGVFTSNYLNALELAGSIKKETGATTIFGGVHPTTQPDIVREKSIDFVVRGEGEITFKELAECLERKTDYSQVKGIAYYMGGIVLTPPRERISDLDSLPLPLRDGFERQKYRVFAINHPAPSKQRTAAMVTSRGCPYSCDFCTNEAMWGRQVNFRSIDNVIGEIGELIGQYGVNHIYFEDETFGADKKRVEELCSEIINKELDFSWSVLMRADSANEDILSLMEKAGCVHIAYGVESPNPEILERMNKGITLEKTKHAFELTYSTGIIPAALFIIGYPEETHDGLRALQEFVPEIEALRYRFSNAYPFPGTRLRERVDRENIWISEAHKDPNRATTEEQVLKCGVDVNYLNQFDKMMMKRIYYSDWYKKRVAVFVEKNPKFEESFKEFYGILAALIR